VDGSALDMLKATIRSIATGTGIEMESECCKGRGRQRIRRPDDFGPG
jgi:hypothetical protein